MMGVRRAEGLGDGLTGVCSPFTAQIYAKRDREREGKKEK